MGPRILMPKGLPPGQPFRPDCCRGRARVAGGEAEGKEGEVDGQRMSLGFVRETLGATESASKKNVSGGSSHRRAKHTQRGESGSVRLAPVAGEDGRVSRLTGAGAQKKQWPKASCKIAEAAQDAVLRRQPETTRRGLQSLSAIARLQDKKPRQVRTGSQDRTGQRGLGWAGLGWCLAGRRCSDQMHRGDDEWCRVGGASLVQQERQCAMCDGGVDGSRIVLSVP